MNNKSNFRRGSVELLILHLLSQQDYYGYEISTLIREQTEGYLNIPVGSLYPALYKCNSLFNRSLIHFIFLLTGKQLEF